MDNPGLEAVVVEGAVAEFVFQAGGGGGGFAEVGFGDDTGAVPVAVAEDEAGDVGEVAGGGIETAVGFFVAAGAVEVPEGIVARLDGSP